MAAIVRVKRRIIDDPADSLVVSCKRPRKSSDADNTENSETEEVKNFFKFAGTMKAEGDCVSRAVRDAIRKEKLEREYKQHAIDASALSRRARARSKAGSELGRYRIVARRRAGQLEELDKDSRQGEPPHKRAVESEAKASVLLNSVGKDKQQRVGGGGGEEEEEGENKENDAGNKDRSEEKLPYKKVSSPSEKENDGDGESEKLFYLYDVEREVREQQHLLQKAIERPKPVGASTITCNSVPLEREEVAPPVVSSAQAPSGGGGGATTDEQYVYDLYYLNRRDLDFRLLENVLAVEALRDESHFDVYRDAANEELEVCDDDDDSNDENNWRNDYPDEDPKFFEEEGPDYCFGNQSYGQGLGLDDDDELGTIIDRGLHLDGGAFGQKLSSDEEEVEEPEVGFDFSQPLDTGIWANDSDTAALWAGGTSSDAVADDWVSKSLQTDLEPGAGLWGAPDSGRGGSGGGGGGVHPWAPVAGGADGGGGGARLWAPTTDFEQYRTRVLSELGGEGEEPNRDLT